MSLFELRSTAAVTEAGVEPVRATRRERWSVLRGDGAGQSWALALVVVVATSALLAFVIGTALVNGDSVWHLIWGRELVHGELDSFSNGPTPHPLLLVAGALSSLLGEQGSFVATYVVFGPIALGVVTALVVTIGRRAGSAWAGAAAALVLLTSMPVLSTAGTARYDVVFAALVLGAILLELNRPRRGTATLSCLAVAGLIRPEAWILAGVYWLWLFPRLDWRRRAGTAALVALAPALWVLMDTLVMGDPLYSLHVTDKGSDAYYRQYTPGENLGAAWRNLISYTGIVPILLAVPGIALLVRDRSRALIPLIGTLGVTLGVFLVFLARGLASSERYLFVPACVLILLAGVSAAGGARRSRARVMFAVFVSVFLLLQVGIRSGVYDRLNEEAGAVHERNVSARALMNAPGVKAAFRECRSVAIPSGRMIHLFAYYSGRSPDRFSSDERGRTRPDMYVAPANDEVAEDALTRPRFDDDPTFTVPPSLKAGLRNADWVLHVAPTSTCTRNLR